MTSAASLGVTSDRSAPDRARDVANRPWPSWRCRARSSRSTAAIGIGAGGAHEDPVDRRGPGVDGDADRRQSGQPVRRFRRAEQRLDVGPLGDRHRLVVAGDRRVEQVLQDPQLRGEQPVERGLGHIGRVADGLDGGGAVAAFEEQVPGGVEDGAPGQPRPRLGRPSAGITHRVGGQRPRGSPVRVQGHGVAHQRPERLLVELGVLVQVDGSPRPASRLALKTPAGSSSEAPWAKVTFTLSL